MLADAGLVGLVIGAFFLVRLFTLGKGALGIRNNYRNGIAVGALAGIFAILVHSIFDFVLHTTAISVMFVTLLALLVASRNSYSDDVEDVRPENSSRRSSGSVSSISSRRHKGRR